MCSETVASRKTYVRSDLIVSEKKNLILVHKCNSLIHTKLTLNVITCTDNGSLYKNCYVVQNIQVLTTLNF